MTLLVRSSEDPQQQQHHSGAAVVAANNGNSSNNFQRGHSSYDDSGSSTASSGSAGEPWDQRDYAAIEVVKNNDYNYNIDNSDNAEDMRTTTTVYEPSDFTTTHEEDDNDEDLNDGELPSLSPKHAAAGNTTTTSGNNSVTSPRNNNNNNNSSSSNNFATGLGGILGRAMPTTRPMQPPSQAGAMKSTNDANALKKAAAAAAANSHNNNSNSDKAQHRKFWGQLDEERQVQDNNNNNAADNDEDGPHDELAARRAAQAIISSVRQQQQQPGRRPQGAYDNNNNHQYHHDNNDEGYQVLGGVESVSLSNASGQEDVASMTQTPGETMTVDSSEEAAHAQSFCGQTLAAISDMCGTSLALTSSHDTNNNNNKGIDKTSKSRRSSEVRDDPPPPWESSSSSNRKQVERQEEHTAIEVEFVEPPQPSVTTATSNAAIAAKKNAYLSAMAAKAKSEFDKGGGNNKEQDDSASTSSMANSAVVIGPASNASMDIYGSFGAQEKRKFLKMINSGQSPSEASQRIVADRKTKAAQKKQAVAEKKAARGVGVGGVVVPRLAFWRKNKKNNKNGKEQEQGGEGDDEEEDEDELMSASSPPRQAQKSDATASSDGASGNAEAADSRSTESPSPPPPPPPPDSAALSPRLSTTASSPSSSVAASSSSKPTSILKKQLLTVDIPNPASPKASSSSSVSVGTSLASPSASTAASASRGGDNAKSTSSSVISAPPSDTAFYHPHRADNNISNYNNKSYPSSTSSVPSGRVSGYLTTTPTSPGSRSAHSMPIITPGVSSPHYLSSPVTSGGGHSGYLSPVSTSHSALSAPVSPSTSALAMGRGDNNNKRNSNSRTLSPPVVDRKNYLSPSTPIHDDLPAAAIAAMRSLETTATNTAPLESNSPKGSNTNDFARISPLISRPDVDHDGSEGEDEDEYYGGQPDQQPKLQISEFAPSGINYYDAVRRDPHSDVDEELEAVIASVARGPNKNTKSTTIKKVKKGPRLTSVSKPKGFAALKDRPRQQQQQQQQRSRSVPRAMRLEEERAQSVSPSPPPSPPPPLPHRLPERDQSPPRAQSEPGGDISPTRSRVAPTNSAKTSILQSAARSLTQAKLAAETSRRTATSSVTGSLLDTPSQDTDAGSSNPIKWVEEEVIRRNASQRSGLSSSMSGDTGERESQRRRASAPATATPHQEVHSLPVVTPIVQAQDDRQMRPVTPPAISRTIESAASYPTERAASIPYPVDGQRSAPASPPHSVKSEPVTSSGSRQVEKEDETHVDTKAMEIDMDTYLSSMDEIAAHNGANFDSQSVYTSATGTSSYTQSSRKRRPGAAKERLAKTKGANQKKNGWHESIRAAATKTNRVWDPESGWTDYHDPDAIAPKSDEKIHINLERMRSKGSKDDMHLDVARRSSDDTVSVPFPKEWENEREKMLGRPQNVAVARVSKEEPMATRKIETQTFLIEPNATKKTEMKPLKKESPLVEAAKSKVEDIMDTLPPIDLVEPPIPLDGPPRVSGRTTPKRTGGASPHRARPTDVASRPIGWLESMRAASAAIATDGRTWDPETGWVADGDEDDESIPDVVDFDAPHAVKEELVYEEDEVYPEPDIPQATVVQSRETITEYIPKSNERTEKEGLRRVVPIPSRDTNGKLKQWVEKSEKAVHEISATEDSDRAVASSSAVNEIYIQLGDNGSVREKSHQDSSVIAPPMVSDTVDFGAPPGLEFSTGDNEDEDARLLDNSCVFPSEDERPLSPPIRIKKEKIAAEDLRLFPPAESQEKRAGRRVAAAVAAAAKRDKLKQARESKYSKEARAAQEHEERREAARLAEYAMIGEAATTTMQRNVAALQPPPQPPKRLDNSSRRISTPPRSTNGRESGQHTPSSPPSPPLTRAAGPITPSPQPLGRKPHKETNSLPPQTGKKQAPLSASDNDEHAGKPEFKRKHSGGPIDVDEVDDLDSDEDQQHANNDWDSRSSSPASSASKSKLAKPVPRLRASKRDTSPVRVRKEPTPPPAPVPAPAPAPTRSPPEPQDKNIPSRGSSPTEEMLTSVPMVAPESPSVQERLRHWEAIVHEQPERREEKTAKVVTRNGKGEKMVVTERTITSHDLESEERKVVTERAVSSANDENGDWESYVETTVVSERVVSTNDGSNVVERTMTTTQKGVRSSPTSEMLNGKLVRKPRGDLFKQTKSEDEDSLFEFGDKKEANALVHSRLSPIRMVEDPEFDDEKTPSENLSVSDAYGPDLSEKRSFLQRLSECAAPVMAGRAGMSGKTSDLPPSAHLAFMSANHVQGSKATAGRFVPPNLCGRPENIIEEAEDDESVQSSPPETQLTRVVTPPPTQVQRPKSAPRPMMRGGDVRPTSSGSVVSDGFGAKTAYLEALAMKTAVSKPRKSRGRSGSSIASGTSPSRASVTSRSSSQHSEKWKAFLDRKKSSDPSPLKPRGSTTSELSTAAERYAAVKLEEMMAKMSEQAKTSRAEDDEYEHEYGRSVEDHSRLQRKEKADLASYVRGRKLVEEARKTESVSAAHDLAAARVEAMMAALSTPQMEDEQAEI